MTSIPSATTWGSPAATKHALLLHGLTSSSHTWHRVASSLAAQGYFVTAPDLVGHASRTSAGADYRFSTVAEDIRPYLEARRYSLIVGHSWGAATALNLFPLLPASHPTAIVLVDPPMQMDEGRLEFLDKIMSDSCVNVTQADAHSAANPLWMREDSIYRELGTRLCSIEAIHGILSQNRPWNYFHYFDTVPAKWKVTVVVADPAIIKVCGVEEIHPYPHIRPVMVPGAGHWIQYEYPDVIVEEALETVAALDTV